MNEGEVCGCERGERQSETDTQQQKMHQTKHNTVDTPQTHTADTPQTRRHEKGKIRNATATPQQRSKHPHQRKIQTREHTFATAAPATAAQSTDPIGNVPFTLNETLPPLEASTTSRRDGRMNT